MILEIQPLLQTNSRLFRFEISVTTVNLTRYMKEKGTATKLQEMRGMALESQSRVYNLSHSHGG